MTDKKEPIYKKRILTEEFVEVGYINKNYELTLLPPKRNCLNNSEPVRLYNEDWYIKTESGSHIHVIVKRNHNEEVDFLEIGWSCSPGYYIILDEFGHEATIVFWDQY